MANKQTKQFAPLEPLPPQTRSFDVKQYDFSETCVDYSKTRKIILCSESEINKYGNDFFSKTIISGGNRKEILEILEKIKAKTGNRNISIEEIEPTAIILEV